MPWFLNPEIYSKLPFYMNTEVWTGVFKLVVTLLFARAMWRQGVRGARLAASTWVFLSGVFLTVMLSMHTLVIIGLRVVGRPAGTPFTYDFRLYSLALLGVVLVAQGIRLMRVAPRLADGVHGAARDAVWTTLTVLALSAPLIPLQFFGVLLTAASVVSLIAIAFAVRTPNRVRTPAAPSPAPRPMVRTAALVR